MSSVQSPPLSPVKTTAVRASAIMLGDRIDTMLERGDVISLIRAVS